MCVFHLVISPPPPSRSAMSRPRSACVLTPPLVVMVTSLLPTNQVILRPPAKRNSAMGDLRGQKRLKSWPLDPLSVLEKHHYCNQQTKKGPCKPLGQGREVGKDISCHHVQTCLGELQVDGLQPLICLSHCIFIS